MTSRRDTVHAPGDSLGKQDAGGSDTPARKPLLKNVDVSWEGRNNETSVTLGKIVHPWYSASEEPNLRVRE